MHRKKFGVIGLAACLALAIACSRQSSAPTTPTGVVASASANDTAGDATLKVTAPTVISPLNFLKLDKLPVTMQAGAATGTFGAVTGLSYRFQLMNPAGAVVQESVLAGLSLDSPSDLTEATKYTWRVRAEAQGAWGPWSSTGSFETPDKPKVAEAYLRGNELFDPLTGGKTIGKWNDVTFQPGGVQLNGIQSFVEWQLETPLTDGEFSFEATNIGNGSESWKTKIMSMLRGDGVNITDNAYRMTIDKRPATSGWASAIRYTLRSHGIDAGEPNCGGQSWSRSNTYFWKYTWSGGQSRIDVYDGGIHGAFKGGCGAKYTAPYSPSPHVIRLGSVGGRAGSETLPGVIIWNVYVGASRPADIVGDK